MMVYNFFRVMGVTGNFINQCITREVLKSLRAILNFFVYFQVQVSVKRKYYIYMFEI